jgi:hypothetical protein
MTITPRVAHSQLSRRARFDIATLVTAGVASTAFFLLPVWMSPDCATASSGPEAARLTAAAPLVGSAIPAGSVLAMVQSPPSTPAPRPRAAIRSAPAKPATQVVRVQAEAKKPQSRLSRLLLGDGNESVRPFPPALRQPQR